MPSCIRWVFCGILFVDTKERGVRRVDKTELNELLRQVADGSVSPEEAALKLKIEPIREVGDYAKVDMHRGIRQVCPR